MGHLEKVREERAQDKQAKQEKAQVGTFRILLLTCYHPYRRYTVHLVGTGMG
jgi:hypothetical protein